MKAEWRGRILAESGRTLAVGGYAYFPAESVRRDLLRPAPKTAEDEKCPHGVRFYDAVDGAAVSPRAAWSYERPTGALAPVKDWFGFWNEVTVR
jgi:uncharacterized protein (DUF427 family)